MDLNPSAVAKQLLLHYSRTGAINFIPPSIYRIHLFQKTLSERTANGSCRMEIARPKGTVVSIFGMQKQWDSSGVARLDSNKNPTNLHLWQWKTVFLHALHVHFSSFDILKTLSFFLWREMTFFAVVWTTSVYDDKWSILSCPERRFQFNPWIVEGAFFRHNHFE